MRPQTLVPLHMRLLAVVSMAFGPLAFAQSVDPAGAARFVERPGVQEFSGRMVVRPLDRQQWLARGVRGGAAVARMQAARNLIAAYPGRHIPQTDEYIIDLPAGETENALAQRLMEAGGFDYVEPDWIVYPLLIPNDTFYNNQWHHPKIQSSSAWNITTGSASIICAFVDTGIDLDHPDLAARLVPGYNSVDRVAQVDGGDINDINGHGTAVAGTACAIGNNGQGVAGVGWNQRIMMCRTSNVSGGGAAQGDILEGARWAAEHGARVVSASYSGVGSQSINQTGLYLRENFEAIFCYAAGNDGMDLAGFDHKYVVVCGASNSSDQRASFSAYGRAVDVFAPGVGIWTTTNGGGYGGVSGTSFSTPMTNGVMSMVLSIDPGFTAEQAELIVFKNCDDLGAPGDDDVFGNGRVNVFKAVQTAAAVHAGNVAPVAESEVAEAYAGESTLLDVLKNDYDFNLDAVAISGFSGVSAHGGVVALSPGTGPNGRDELLYTPPTGYLGPDSLSYTASDGSLTDAATVSLAVLDGSGLLIPAPPASPALNLTSAYYALSNPTQLPDFSGLTPASTGLVENLNYAWSTGQFPGSGMSSNVGAVYSGWVDVPVSDVYTFTVASDDGARLFVGGQLVVDVDGVHGLLTGSGDIGLRAGMHSIRVEYFKSSGFHGLTVSIESDLLTKRPIPASWLYHAGCAADLDGDGQIALGDLSILLSNFGETGVGPDSGDLSGDEAVDLSDVSLLLAVFGEGCQ